MESDQTQPYSNDDLVRLRAWANSQSTEQQTRRARAVLAFGAGAGLQPHDLLSMTAGAVVRDDNVVIAHVPGNDARTVPVLAAWEDMALQAADGLHPDDKVFPRVGTARPSELVREFVGTAARRGDI